MRGSVFHMPDELEQPEPEMVDEKPSEKPAPKPGELTPDASLYVPENRADFDKIRAAVDAAPTEVARLVEAQKFLDNKKVAVADVMAALLLAPSAEAKAEPSAKAPVEPEPEPEPAPKREPKARPKTLLAG